MDNLQDFFTSTAGKGVSIAAIAVIFVLILIFGRPKQNAVGESEKTHVDTLSLTVSAVFIAAAFVLGNIRLFSMPQGGTVTPLSMLPIAILAYLFGTRTGVMAGTVLGLVNLIVNPFVVHPAQLILDYVLAFAALGFGGFLRNTRFGLPGVYLVGIFGRFICSTLSGVIFFGSYAEGTGLDPLLYSIVYNGTYIGAEGIITLIVIMLPPVHAVIEKIKEQLDS